MTLFFTLFSITAYADFSDISHQLQSAQYETVYFSKALSDFVKNPPVPPTSVDPVA